MGIKSQIDLIGKVLGTTFKEGEMMTIKDALEKGNGNLADGILIVTWRCWESGYNLGRIRTLAEEFLGKLPLHQLEIEGMLIRRGENANLIKEVLDYITRSNVKNERGVISRNE